MKVLILVGSGEARSKSLTLGREIENALKNLTADTELINLVEYQLPMYNLSSLKNESYDSITKDFLDKSYSADAFVWVTPIYHNSFSGILKNALDWQHTKFPGKVVGIASHGGNRASQAADQLLLVARAQHLLSTRQRVCTQADDYDDKHKLTSDDIKTRISELCKELFDLSNKIVA